MRDSSTRVYDKIRTLVEDNGGRMFHEKQGHPPGGAWIIELDGLRGVFSPGGHKYPGIDKLYKPKPDVANPQVWRDYEHELRGDALSRLIEELKSQQA